MILPSTTLHRLLARTVRKEEGGKAYSNWEESNFQPCTVPDLLSDRYNQYLLAFVPYQQLLERKQDTEHELQCIASNGAKNYHNR